MNCQRAEALLQARLDGELSVPEAIELGRHLGVCAACSALSADFEHLATIAIVPPAHPREGCLARQVLRQLSASPPPRVEWHRPGRRLLAAAALAAAVMLGILVCVLVPPAQPVALRNGPSQPEVSLPEVETPAAAQPGAGAFDGFVAARALYADSAVDEDELTAEQVQQRHLAELVRALGTKGKACSAAKELAAMTDNPQVIWTLAAASSNPAIGAEVFSAIAELQPEMSLAPVYISALDAVKTRQRATELLRQISGKKFGSQREVWLAWWASTRQQRGVPAGPKG